jgi:hypothetical protein
MPAMQRRGSLGAHIERPAHAPPRDLSRRRPVAPMTKAIPGAPAIFERTVPVLPPGVRPECVPNALKRHGEDSWQAELNVRVAYLDEMFGREHAWSFVKAWRSALDILGPAGALRILLQPDLAERAEHRAVSGNGP